MNGQTGQPLWRLPQWCGWLLIVAMHGAYLLAAGAGHVPWCIPYLEGCSSISAVGRQPPGELLFKGLMLPALVLMVYFWLLCHRWLARLPDVHSMRLSVMAVLGVVGALMLMLYVLSLGESGEPYRVMRRVGVNLGVGCSYLAQLLQYGLAHGVRLNRGWQRCHTWHVWLFLVLGVMKVLAEAVVPPPLYERVLEDSFEWVLLVLLSLYFFIVANLWKSTRFALRFSSK